MKAEEETFEVKTRNGLYGFEMLEQDNRRSPERQTPQIKQLWQRSHEIINLAARGFKQTEIAEILNIHPQTVSNTLNSELGERKLSELRFGRDEEARIVAEKIRVLRDKALQVYNEMFDDDSGECTMKDKKAVADTVVLELSGLRVPTKIQSHSVHTTLTYEEIEEFKARGNALRAGTSGAQSIHHSEESDLDHNTSGDDVIDC